MRKLVDGGRISALSTAIMTTIGFLEIVVSFITGSIALLGDAIDSFADATTSLVVWVGLRISKRAPDSKFHFGYLKVETFFSMLGAIIIAGVGLVVMYESYAKLFVARELKEGNIAIGTSFVAMIISTVVLIYKARAARKLEMLSMKTEVVNSFTDSLSSISAFIGITLSEKLGIIQFDSIVGIIIGIFVLTSSYMIIKESSLVLMDACTCSDVHGDLETLVRSIPGVEKVKSVRLRRMGSYIVGDISVVVDGSLSVDEANRISQRVEKEAKKVFDDISEIVVKFEPSEKKASQINHSCTIHE